MTPHLPENIRKCMTPEDRKRMGVLTNSEKGVEVAAKNERELQKQISNFLHMKGIWFDYDLMQFKRRGTTGAPDYQFCYLGKYIAWEAKFGVGKLSEAQEEVRSKIEGQGGQWRLVRTIQDCRDHLRELDALHTL